MLSRTTLNTKLPFVLALSAMVIACGPSASGDGDAPRPRRGGRELILAEELIAAGSSNTLDAVRRLRPTWLRSRSSGTPQNPAGPPVVFVDNVRRGDIQTLQSIPVEQIEEIRYVNGRDATTRWGTGYGNGVIHVILKG